MPVTRTILASFAVVMFVVAACASSGASPVPSANGVPSAGVTIGTASSADFGTVLTGPNGMTLYTHAGDSATSSTCTGQCATAWPPLATSGQPSAATGVTGQLGTLTRPDGTTQATYAGMPLYYWQGDAKAGDVSGNGVDGFSVATVGGAAPMPSGPAAAPSQSSSGKYGY